MRISSSQIQAQGIRSITDLSAQAANTQQQIASGRRIRTPSDDPSGAATVIRLNQQLAARERYIGNADRAEAALQQEESVLTRVTESLQRVRELTLQAGDPAFGEDERAFLGAELSVRFTELLDLVNSRDADGKYLFSGYRGDVEPFQFDNGTVRYQGDRGQRALAISDARALPISDSGAALFAGAAVSFPTIRVAAGNTGIAGSEAVPLTVGVNNTENLGQIDAKRIEVAISEVNGQTFVDLRDADDGTSIGDGFSIPFGQNLSLDQLGLELNFAAVPPAGSTYLLEVSSQQGLLTTVNRVAQAMVGGPDQVSLTETALRDVIDQTLIGIDRSLDNILGTQATLGARLNAIDSTRELHEDVILKTQAVLSDTRDIDFAEAVSNLSYQSFVLEAAQQSFIRVSRLSLFNSL
ncbi:MAG: flagellar hook-associated protein FlgL [Pseudomonadota bacterium]